MARKSTAKGILDGLHAHGIERIFCLPRVQNDGFFAELFDMRERFDVVHARHEQGAAYMALGHALASGKPSVYCVVPGPGFLNTTTALATAWSTGARVLALVGQLPQRQIGRGHGLLHEIPDQDRMLASLTGWSARVESPLEAPALVDEAFRSMAEGRPRPAGLEVPMDVWSLTAEVPESCPQAPRPRPLDEVAIDQAARLLASARKPMMVVGGGALDAADQVRAVAELLGAPVSHFRMGHGVLDARHPLSVPHPVGYRLWKESDVVLAVGTRLQMQQLGWGTDERLAIVRIDIDPVEIGRVQSPAVGIAGDAGRCLAALARRLPEYLAKTVARNPTAGRQAEIEAARKAFAAEIAHLEPQLTYLDILREALGDDGILVDELTQIGYVGRFAWPARTPRKVISSGYQGTLGWGVATAIGVRFACPRQRVLSINGDGGFMFNLAELATAVQWRLPIVFLVMDDGAFGNVRRIQEQQYGNRVIATDLANPDFAAMAETFGARGMRAHDPQSLASILPEAFAHAGPVVIHLRCGPMPDPWKFMLLPPIRGNADPVF
ncbi:MAG: thiamine pyrophosphate-binding protein [Geminicoccaceae bacterium]